MRRVRWPRDWWRATRRGRVRDLVVELVDGERAASSRWAGALREAGYRSMGTGLRYFTDLHQ